MNVTALAEVREALSLIQRHAQPKAIVPLLERALKIVRSDAGLTCEVHGLLGSVYERWALYEDEVRHRAQAGLCSANALVLAGLRAGEDTRARVLSEFVERPGVWPVVAGAARVFLGSSQDAPLADDVLDASPRLAMLCAVRRGDAELALAYREWEASAVGGFALARLGQDEAAEEMLHAVVRAKTAELEEALIEMADLYARTDRFVEAEGLYRSSLEYLAEKVQTADVRRLRIRGAARFAGLLRRLEWNGKTRAHEAERLEAKMEAEVWTGMLPHGDSDDLTFAPTWIVNEQEKDDGGKEEEK